MKLTSSQPLGPITVKDSGEFTFAPDSAEKSTTDATLEQNFVDEMIRLHDELTGLFQQSLDKAICLGELLIQQKVALDHGQFGNWVRENLPFTVRTAQNYMRICSEKDRLKCETVSHLTEAYSLLAEPKIDDELAGEHPEPPSEAKTSTSVSATKRKPDSEPNDGAHDATAANEESATKSTQNPDPKPQIIDLPNVTRFGAAALESLTLLSGLPDDSSKSIAFDINSDHIIDADKTGNPERARKVYKALTTVEQKEFLKWARRTTTARERARGVA